jgi:2,5-diketo-D-gluconate reductase A
MDTVSSARVALSDGTQMPVLGLGLYKVADDIVAGLVSHALSVGYRLIDTASMYDNEEGVGRALAASDVPRSEIQVATKFWMDDLGYENTLKACRGSLSKLGLEYLDFYLIHWPAPQRDLYVDSWRAMEKLKADGLVRSIGVCNFHAEHLDRLAENSDARPVINQVELHPWLTQEPLVRYHQQHGIVTQAWSPLARGQVLADEVLIALAEEYEVSVAQLVLRWHLQRGITVIPKSNSTARITENSHVFGFELSEGHMSLISGLNRNYRTGVDPNDRN